MNITPSPLKHYKTIEEYLQLFKRLSQTHVNNKKIADFKEKEKADKELINLKRLLLRTDLFFLLYWGCKKTYINNQWLLDRCKEVENEPNGCLDLWAREHLKSTIVTFGVSIQHIIASHGDDPLPEWERETTIGILSVTRPLAKSFLREMKLTFENQHLPLIIMFPDIFFKDPKGESPKWSEDDGIIVKRKSNPKESTIEAWGLVGAQPTGKHFFEIVYDDIVTQDSVTTLEMIHKTTSAWGLSDNIGTRGGLYRAVGTPYAANDTLQAIIDSGTMKIRKHPGTFGGEWPIDNDSQAPLLTKEQLEQKYNKQGVYNFSCQILLNPVISSLKSFKFEWFKKHAGWNPAFNANMYIIVDPANSKKKTSDYTVIMVIGAGHDGNYYIADMVRDRLNLRERTDQLFKFVHQYKPIVTGYEQYGMQADIEHIEEKQDKLNYHFNIIALGGKTSKIDRIGGLMPDFQAHKIFFPYELFKNNYENKMIDLTKSFLNEEYLKFPTSNHDDMLDCLARIKDPAMNVTFPMPDFNTDDDGLSEADGITGY